MALVNAFGALALDSTLADVLAHLDAVIDDTDGFEKMIVGNIQGRVNTNFMGASMPQDGFSTVSTGTGMTVSLDGVANGSRYLKIATGTTTNQVTIIEHSQLFTLPCRLSVQLSMSQRIANQEVWISLEGVDGAGVVETDGTGPLNFVALVFDGTTAANAKIVSRNKSGSIATGTAAAVGTTAATGSTPNFIPAMTYDIQAHQERVVASGYAVNSVAVSAGTIAYNLALPDPAKKYKLRFRIRNLGTAPASTTDVRIHAVRVLDMARLAAELTGGVGRTDGQAGVPVTGAVTATVSGTVTANTATPTASAVNSAATTNATLVKNAAGTVHSITCSNVGAAVAYVKFYNKASAPTVGTDVPVIVIPVPAGQVVNVSFNNVGYRFATGIGLGITNLAPDNDTTAVAAAQVKVLTSYI